MAKKPTDVVIVAAKRTPGGKLMGALSAIPATELGARAIAAALEAGGIDKEQPDAVIMGQVLQAGVGQNPAKQAALGAGISQRAHTLTVNKVCLSGLTAIIDAARLLCCGEAQVVVAGGMESMSLAPHLLPHSRRGFRFGEVKMLDHMAFDALTAAGPGEFEGSSMGLLTERFAHTYPISRDEQDAWAVQSHHRAGKAQDEGVFADEMVGVDTLESDEGVRRGVSVESLAKLRPVFCAGGTITAGNASQITDGAAACVLTTREYADKRGLGVLATVRACGQIAGPDPSLQAKPARALEQALEREGWSAADLDMVEINEAFAAVTLQSAKELGVALERVNPHGGAIALGHPVGASGARLVVHAAHMLNRGKFSKAGVALCGGGGQGEALLLEAG